MGLLKWIFLIVPTGNWRALSGSFDNNKHKWRESNVIKLRKKVKKNPVIARRNDEAISWLPAASQGIAALLRRSQ